MLIVRLLAYFSNRVLDMKYRTRIATCILLHKHLILAQTDGSISAKIVMIMIWLNKSVNNLVENGFQLGTDGRTGKCYGQKGGINLSTLLF